MRISYDNPRDLYSHRLSDFVVSKKMQLAVMPNGRKAVFTNWLISTSYAPFISAPKSHDFPSYLQDCTRNEPGCLEPLDSYSFEIGVKLESF